MMGRRFSLGNSGAASPLTPTLSPSDGERGKRARPSEVLPFSLWCIPPSGQQAYKIPKTGADEPSSTIQTVAIAQRCAQHLTVIMPERCDVSQLHRMGASTHFK